MFKRILFPGLNVGTRKRMKFCRYFLPGNIATLDAGCGNGAFVFQAFKLRNEVLGINLDPYQVKRCEEYRDYVGINSLHCQFKVYNIYDLLSLNQKFDQIICFETLEHLKKDEEVIAIFRDILKPSGVLHICTPRGNRRPYFGEVLSEDEDGGHVRLGYTFKIFEEMLGRHNLVVTHKDSAIGFFSLKIEETINYIEKIVFKNFPELIREILHTGIFLCLYPFTYLDWIVPNRDLSIYVQARRVS
jgi:SAM-dependent methyltransferase